MNILFDANVQYVLFGSVFFGISSGVLGCFAFLRKRALVGDAIAHAALHGICIAYLLTQTKHPLVIILGAATTALLGSFAINVITEKSRIKEDAAIGLVLSVFFGIGILLLTYIQHQPYGNQSGLDKFLFGQAASLIGRDVQVFGTLAVLLLVAVFFAYKEFKLMAFDRSFASAIGLPTTLMDVFLTLLIVLVVTTGLQAVCVVLMASMLITPAAAARQWTDRLPVMLLLAGLFGAFSGATGSIASALAPRMPTGPWIVMTITLFFAISILMAPKRGILPRWQRHRGNHRRMNCENILLTFYRLEEEGSERFFSLDEIRRYRALSVRSALQLLSILEQKELILGGEKPEHWQLTSNGRSEAKKLIRRHRLWELYLSRYLHLRHTQVHVDAEEIEHILTPELEAELETLLQHPKRDPHLKPIPESDHG